MFAALQQARDSVKAAANGFHGQLRIALSDGITPPRLPTLLAFCRQEEPEVDIRLFQVPLSQQIKGLQDDLYDVGFAQSDEVGEGIAAEAVWNDPLMVAVPARHHLLKHRRIPLDEVLHFPLVLCDPQACEATRDRLNVCCAALTGASDRRTCCLIRLDDGGRIGRLRLGLAGAPHIVSNREPGVVARPWRAARLC